MAPLVDGNPAGPIGRCASEREPFSTNRQPTLKANAQLPNLT
jgi:hypothetical protein